MGVVWEASEPVAVFPEPVYKELYVELLVILKLEESVLISEVS